jgi:hypothetical protein
MTSAGSRLVAGELVDRHERGLCRDPVLNWRANSFALFMLSRRGDPVDSEVGLLLNRRGVDVCVAGEILVDGMEVSRALRTQVVSALAALAPRLGLSSPEAGTLDYAVASVLDALRRGEPYRRWLLVFDSANPTRGASQPDPAAPRRCDRHVPRSRAWPTPG